MSTRFLILIVVAVAIASPMLAHHSVKAQFDASKSTTIMGAITKVEWGNPHVWIYMDTKDASGKNVSWRVQIGAPNALYRDGMRKEMFDMKSSVQMQIWPAFVEESKDYKIANGQLLTLSDGRKFDVHDKWIDMKVVKSNVN